MVIEELLLGLGHQAGGGESVGSVLGLLLQSLLEARELQVLGPGFVVGFPDDALDGVLVVGVVQVALGEDWMLVHPRLDVFRRGFGVVEQLAQAVGRGLELVGVGGRMLNMGGQSLMMLLGHVVQELLVVGVAQRSLERVLVARLEVSLGEGWMLVDPVLDIGGTVFWHPQARRLVGSPDLGFQQLLQPVGGRLELVGVGNHDGRLVELRATHGDRAVRREVAPIGGNDVLGGDRVISRRDNSVIVGSLMPHCEPIRSADKARGHYDTSTIRIWAALSAEIPSTSVASVARTINGCASTEIPSGERLTNARRG